jgi:hypothetical protein
MDPIGLTLERFDGAGQLRSMENGAPIDVGGELDGHTFEGAGGLGVALHDDPAAAACIVSKAYQYAAGRAIMPGERDWIAYLNQSFATSRYQFVELLRNIAAGAALYQIAPDQGAPATAAASAPKEPRS